MNKVTERWIYDYCEAHDIDLNALKLMDVSPYIMDFDPKTEYAFECADHAKINNHTTHRIQMGRIAHLIERMVLQGATKLEIVQAVRHSMVVLDSLKHDLNWKKSLIDHNIDYLERKYPKRTEVDKVHEHS